MAGSSGMRGASDIGSNDASDASDAYTSRGAQRDGANNAYAPHSVWAARQAHPMPGRKGHARRTAQSAAAERRRRQYARQSRPNVADLPRSAPIAAMGAALRRRTATTRPTLPAMPEPSSLPTRPASRSVPLWRRLSDEARNSVAYSRTPAASEAPVARTSERLAQAPVPTSMQVPVAASAPVAAPHAAGSIMPGGLERAARPRSAGPMRTRARIGPRHIVSLALLLAIVLALIPVPSLAYNNTIALARSGAAHLKTAEDDFKALAASPTNLTTITDAQNELQLAHNDFFQLQLRLTLLGPAEAIPGVGTKLAAAEKLVPLAVNGTQAGVLACDALRTLVTGLKNPLGTSGGLTVDDTNQIIGDIDQIRALYTQMEPQIASLTPSDLSLYPSLWPTVASLQTKLPQATQMINDLDGVAHVLPQLLGVGKPSTYLVEVLDSSELRPTGGFIGNFGALTLDSGRLDAGFHISDITLIDSSVKFGDAKYKQFIPIPAKYSWLNAVFVDPHGNSWSLRDSNLDPNYPTAAQYALQLYPRLLPEAQKNLDAQRSDLTLYDPARSGQFVGVITLSLGIFEQALKITGPLSVPSFHETVTSNNFVSLIHSYALGSKATGSDSKACGVTSCAKTFTSAVVSAFMAKIKSNLPLYVGQMGKLFYDSLRTKDVEVYLTPTPAQQMLHDLNLSAEVAAPRTGDSVYEVDANIGANKDNYFLKYQMADHITISQAGDATHHLAWSYQWPNDPKTLKETFAAGGPDYESYSRVYTPPNARFISQKNLVGFGSGSAFSRRVFHGSVTDSYARASSYALTWTVPGVVTHDSAGYHYALTFQREAGITWPLTLSVTLPKCATLIGAPVTSGLTAQNKVSIVGNIVTITGPLTMDAHVQLNYSCMGDSSTSSQTNQSSSVEVNPHWQTVAALFGANADLPKGLGR